MGGDADPTGADCADLFFETFPAGGPWCLQWINWLQQNSTDPFDPLVECRFIGVEKGYLANKKAFAASGWLPFLTIGSIWQDKKPAGDNVIIVERSKFHLDINAETIHEFDGYDRVAASPAKAYILPPSAFRLYSPGVRMVGVRIGRDPYGLVIPAVTLAQFYVGSSTALAQAFLSGSFLHQPWTLCDLGRTHFVKEGVFRICPRRAFTRDDAPILARFFASPDNSAERAAYLLPYEATAAAAAGRRPAELYATFPFVGRTELMGKGIWYDALLPDGSKVKRFLMLHPESCTGPLPYKELIIEVDEADPSEQLDEIGRSWVHSIGRYVGPTRMVLDRRPNRHLPPKDVVGPSVSHRFRALEEIPITIETRKRRAEAPPPAHIPGDHLTPDTGATGPLSSDGGAVRHTRAVTDENEVHSPPVVSPMVELFTEMLLALSRRPDIANVASVVLCGTERRVGPFVFGKIPPHLNGGTWHKIDNRTSRLLLAAEFTWKGRWVCVVALEPRPNRFTEDWKGLMLVGDKDGCHVSIDDLRLIAGIIRRRYDLWGERVNKGLRSTEFADLPDGMLFARITKAGPTGDEHADAALEKLVALFPARTAIDAEGETRAPEADEDRHGTRPSPAAI